MVWSDYIPTEISELYEVHDHRHAAALLACEFHGLFEEICSALLRFRFQLSDVTTSGGNESNIPKHFSALLRPLGWVEDKLTAKIMVGDKILPQDTHKVDYLKDRVAFDLEWNSKDQTFDRDLYAFKTFFEYDRISVGVLVTRSTTLAPWFKELNLQGKYGASTTHMGKLLHRLEAGRSGGCPVLAFGITKALLEAS